MNKYLKLKKSQEKRVNDFPQFFAFDNSQFEEGLKKLGVTKEEILNSGYGGFIRKSDKEAYKNMWVEIDNELNEALKDEVFLFEAFRYELANHEYSYTYDETPALNCLGLRLETLTDKQKEILKKATEKYLKDVEED